MIIRWTNSSNLTIKHATFLCEANFSCMCDPLRDMGDNNSNYWCIREKKVNHTTLVPEVAHTTSLTGRRCKKLSETVDENFLSEKLVLPVWYLTILRPYRLWYEEFRKGRCWRFRETFVLFSSITCVHLKATCYWSVRFENSKMLDYTFLRVWGNLLKFGFPYWSILF